MVIKRSRVHRDSANGQRCRHSVSPGPINGGISDRLLQVVHSLQNLQKTLSGGVVETFLHPFAEWTVANANVQAFRDINEVPSRTYEHAQTDFNSSFWRKCCWHRSNPFPNELVRQNLGKKRTGAREPAMGYAPV
jgi:hypothetical protein